MDRSRHLLINGLSVGTGGGYTVARGLTRHLGLARPKWRVTLLLTAGNPHHERMRDEWMPANVAMAFAPPRTQRRVARAWYERRRLPEWCRAQDVAAVVQLNGMTVPTVPVPTLAHFQDPWPLRREAWAGRLDAIVAAVKRWSIRRSVRRAAWCGFTSNYLRDLICRHAEADDACRGRSSVFYNGLPRSYATRLTEPLDDWSARPMTIVTVSDVLPHKRQSLVIRALPALLARPAFANATYRIIGTCDDAQRRALESLAASLGVAHAVRIEGRLDDAAVQSAIGTSRAFVLMSVCESFGLPAIEAMSTGTPVVAADCCAVPEICGDAAELCPVDDAEALADRLAGLLSNVDRAETLRRRGRERVTHFQWMDAAEQMACAVQRVLVNNGGGGASSSSSSRSRHLPVALWAAACRAAAAALATI